MTAITKTAMLCGVQLSLDHAEIYTDELLEFHKYDHLDTIVLALQRGRNDQYGKIYKFSYPVIKEWISHCLEDVAIAREKAHQKLKQVDSKTLQGVDYDAYRTRVKTENEARDEKRAGQKRLTDEELIERFVAGVALQFGTTPEQMHKKCRERACTDARACAQHFQRHILCWTFERIGKYWGQDHSTVVHGIKKAIDLGLVPG